MTHSLLPERRDQLDFFVCDILDAVPKDDLGSMEHPMFALSKNKDTAIRHYEHNGNSVTITPSVLGLATIHDKDVLIYCVSQLMQALNEDRPVSKTVRVTAYNLLKSTNRPTAGTGYQGLEAALERLSGTRIKTNILTGGVRIRDIFGLIDKVRIIERSPTDSRMVSIEITLSDWLYNAVLSSEVLTIHKDYFRLGKGIERRLYELARKHCGKQRKWPIGLELLQKKCGSKGTLKKFRQNMMTIIDANQLPDYRMMYSEKGDKVTFYSRKPEGQKQQNLDLIKDALSGNTPRF